MCLGTEVTKLFDATALAADVRGRRRSAVDIVRESLERIARHRTNAVIATRVTAALDEAGAIDAAIERGDDPGPLAGVPFTVKDTLAAAGLGATAGSLLFAENVATVDATVVARLRAAGGVLVGKTNCPEFALQARTDNRLFGATRHPLDPALSPGGSSGGCAAAVAGGLVPFSIGGDYGGSVRYPASCTGIYGLRPTYLGVPTDGHVPSPGPGSPRHRFQAVGPLARSPRDIGLVFGVIAGEAPTGRAAAMAKGARVGVVRGGWTCFTSVTGALDTTADALVAVGCDVVEIEADPFLEAASVFDAWRASDDYADLRALARGRESELTPHVAHLLSTEPRPAPRDLARRFDEICARVAVVMTKTPFVVLPVAHVGVLAIDATTIEIGGCTESVDALQILAPARAVSLLGLPALAVPAGSDGAGLPVGAQLVGPAGSERGLVEIAQRIESAPAFGDAPMGPVDDHL